MTELFFDPIDKIMFIKILLLGGQNSIVNVYSRQVVGQKKKIVNKGQKGLKTVIVNCEHDP